MRVERYFVQERRGAYLLVVLSVPSDRHDEL